MFERLTQLYLQTTPEYRTELQDVWLLREVPADIRKRLNLPGPDEGIDLIARTRHGEYWAIQSKFRSQRDIPLNRRELGTFTSLAFNTCNDIALVVVAHTSTKPVSKHHLMRKTVEIGLDRWQFGRGLIGRPYVPRLKISHRLFAARCVAVIIDRGRLLAGGYRPKPRLVLSCLRVAPEAADYCSRPID